MSPAGSTYKLAWHCAGSILIAHATPDGQPGAFTLADAADLHAMYRRQMLDAADSALVEYLDDLEASGASGAAYVDLDGAAIPAIRDLARRLNERIRADVLTMKELQRRAAR